MLFGRKKKGEGKTFLILDIETGSVGGALLRQGYPGDPPRLFGEMRVDLPAGGSRDAHTLRERAAQAVLSIARSLAEVAARLRRHPATARAGAVQRASVFLAAPWGTPNLEVGYPTFNEPLVHSIDIAVASTFDVPVSFHARASAALNGARLLLPYEGTYLLCMPTGELVEGLSVERGVVRSYGTLPAGRHTIIRTLGSHTGLNEQEARSALRATSLGQPLVHINEPYVAAGQHMAREFTSLARDLGWHAHERVYALTHDNDWFARSLAGSDAATLFAPGATIKHLQGTYASPHFAQHSETPDLPLMLGGMFVDGHYR